MITKRVIATLLLLWLGCTVQLSGQPTDSERKTFERTKASAEKGDPEAQLKLGQLYANGVGVSQDLSKAAKWHRKAAEQGLAQAQYQVGWDYDSGEGVKKNKTEATTWIRMAAEQGMVEAEYELGLRYLNGRGVQESGTEAISWFHKAADNGYAPGEYQIGLCYLDGIGVPKSIDEGTKWIRSAAERGVALAQSKYGSCYEKGVGVPKDLVQAYKWFALSAAHDDDHSLDIKISLAKLESHMTHEEVAEAQRQAAAFKPVEKSSLAAANPADLNNNASQAPSTPATLENAKTGIVTVKSDDERCEVFVDGSFVGNSPAKLKLPEGPHVVEVKKAGFKDYRRELKVMAGSDLTLTAALEKP